MSRFLHALVLLLLLLAMTCNSQNTYQSRLIQFMMGPFVSCNTWSSQTKEAVKQFMQSSLINNINSRCNCQFNTSQLTLTTLLCGDPTHSNYPTFRTTITTVNAPITTITGYIEEWVLQGSAVSDGLGFYEVDSFCTVFPESSSSPGCTRTETEGYSSIVLIGALMSEFIVLIVLFCIVMAVVLSFYSYKVKKTNFALRKQMRKRLNSTQSHDSSYRSEKSYHSDVARIDMKMKMQSCQAYATSI